MSLAASPPLDADSHALALDVVRIEDEAQFEKLADCWNAAARTSTLAHLFLSHEWAMSAWAWRRLDASLALLVARDATGAVAVLPLLRTRNSPRCLELLTVPDTQFADLIAASDRACDAAEAFAAALARSRDWDVMRLDYLQPESAIARHLVPALERHGVNVEVVARGTNQYIALDHPWDAYFAARSRRLKKALNLAGNRLRKLGTVKIERIDASADDAAFSRAIDTAIAISAASWKATTGNSLDHPGPQAFIRTLSAAARERGWLTLWLLHLDGQPLAMEYQLTDGRRVHALRADHVVGRDDISPGTHLFRELLEALFDGLHQRYYLGPGDNRYKARWSEHGEPMVRAAAYHRTLRGRLGWLWATRMKPLLRRVRDRLRRRDENLVQAPENGHNP